MSSQAFAILWLVLSMALFWGGGTLLLRYLPRLSAWSARRRMAQVMGKPGGWAQFR